MIKETIENIIKNKSRVVVLSPHFDDAIFSMGGLLNELKNKAEITVVNIFTKQSKPYTLSAKKFLSQCGYKDLETLYKDREIEDKKALTQVGAKIINLDFEDALFRKIEKPNFIQNFLGKRLPEFLHIYPTYKLNIVKGKVSQNDKPIIEKIVNNIKKLKLSKNDYLFAPTGIGNHVDHRIVRNVAELFCDTTNLFLYADYPYLKNSRKISNNFSEFKFDRKMKEKLMKGYKSQFNAVFQKQRIKDSEYFKKYTSSKAKSKPSFLFLGTLIFVVLILLLSIRGNYGNPNVSALNTLFWRDNGPLELSPERGRFALLYSIVEDKSFYFSVPLARFILPDLGYKNGHYVSLFAPAVSYLSMPGYLIGRYFGISQVGAFSTSGFFGIINLCLIYLIVAKFSNNKIAGILAGMTFLFATPAYAYAINLYQHHISTFLILMSIYLLINWKGFWSSALIFFLCAMSIPVDYPNIFLMTPIGLVAISMLFNFEKLESKTRIKIAPIKILSLFSVLVPLIFFLWFNQMSYSNPLQFSGTVQGVHAIDQNGLPTQENKINLQNVEDFVNQNSDKGKKTAVGFFNSRNILNGFYIHLISPDRGIITFTPVLLLGIIGVFILYKNKNRYLSTTLGVIGFNIFLYSMWGDPWGGWAFGSRYLIPTYAILSIFLGVAIAKLNRNIILVSIFWLTLIYSIFVNTLGALTTSTNPPKSESLALEAISGKRERYSYDRNWEFLNAGRSKSFIFQTWAYKYVDSVRYFYMVAGSIAFVSTLLTIGLILNKNYETK